MPKSMLKFTTFQKHPKIKKTSQGAIFSRKRVRGSSPGGQFSGARAPRERPQVRARVKRKKGAAERKKKQERKKGYKVTRVQEGSEHGRGQRPNEY